MAVVNNEFSNNELRVYEYLTNTMKLNTAAACGVMANIYHESRFDHLARGDGDTSFGLCQWHKTRKTSLIEHCRRNRISYQTVEGQMSFLRMELNNAYKSVLNTLTKVSNTAAGAYDAAHKFCMNYEVPANASSKAIERGTLASNTYWNAYRNGATLPAGTTYTTNYGSKIVQIAKENLGKPYKAGAAGPNNFDAAGLVYYCYNKAGYPIEKKSAASYYSTYSKKAKSIPTTGVSAGDLLFYSNPLSGVYHIAIADGNGGRIHTNSSVGKVVVDTGTLGSPSYILRIVADSETTQYKTVVNYGDTSVGYEDAVEDFTALTVRDDHAVKIGQNLSRVEAVGFDYGYLIDLTHGGEFKFYIPEFTESAGASWEDISIIGRSVSIKAYSHTNSRTINIALDLYAGAGLYDDKNHEDIVGKLHKDANFIKSLEYPDYSNAIVRPPSTVQLILGSSINLVGVVSDVNVEHLKPLDSQNRSMYIKVSFSVTQTAVNPPDYSDIKEGRYVLTSTDNVSSLTTPENKTNAPNFTG